MDIESIEKELRLIQSSPFANKTDKQLWSYQELAELYKIRTAGIQPECLRKYNNPKNRKCKLSSQQVSEIKAKYKPHIYGKKKLAQEYSVSASVIYRIIKGVSWADCI